MPRYEIKKGYENAEFSQEGVRRVAQNIIESDHSLESPLLTLVKEAPAEQPAATPVAPATPPAPAVPPAPPQNQPQTQESEN